jgi:hypothetical protein
LANADVLKFSQSDARGEAHSEDKPCQRRRAHDENEHGCETSSGPDGRGKVSRHDDEKRKGSDRDQHPRKEFIHGAHGQGGSRVAVFQVGRPYRTFGCSGTRTRHFRAGLSSTCPLRGAKHFATYMSLASGVPDGRRATSPRHTDWVLTISEPAQTPRFFRIAREMFSASLNIFSSHSASTITRANFSVPE